MPPPAQDPPPTESAPNESPNDSVVIVDADSKPAEAAPPKDPAPEIESNPQAADGERKITFAPGTKEPKPSKGGKIKLLNKLKGKKKSKDKPKVDPATASKSKQKKESKPNSAPAEKAAESAPSSDTKAESAAGGDVGPVSFRYVLLRFRSSC